MAFTFNPFTGTFDNVGSSSSSSLGTLANPFPSTGRYFYDTSGILWVETIDTTGHLVTTKYVAPAGSDGTFLALFGLGQVLIGSSGSSGGTPPVGSGIGLLLTLTHAT